MLGTRPADKRQNGHACPFCRSAACYETPTAPDRVASCASPAVPTTQLLFFQAQLIERDAVLHGVGPTGCLGLVEVRVRRAFQAMKAECERRLQ